MAGYVTVYTDTGRIVLADPDMGGVRAATRVARATDQPPTDRHLFDHRRAAGLTREQIADLLRIPEADVYAWETGRRSIPQARRRQWETVCAVTQMPADHPVREEVTA